MGTRPEFENWVACLGSFDGKTTHFHIADYKHGSTRPIVVCDGGENYTPEELEENAHLIAAAPKLLNAMRKLLMALGEGTKKGRAIDIVDYTYVQAALSAIAAAEGRE